MSQKQSEAQTKFYPKISFKKCLLLNNQHTINQLIFNPNLPQSLRENKTIKKCIDMHLKNQKKMYFSFLIAIVAMKLGTYVFHMNRGMALSAPRNWTSFVFKYVMIPYLYGVKRYSDYMNHTVQRINTEIEEDPQADQLWQSIFQKKYPDPTKPIFATHSRKFYVDDIAKISSKKLIAIV